jgi:hypothetical protein
VLRTAFFARRRDFAGEEYNNFWKVVGTFLQGQKVVGTFLQGQKVVGTFSSCPITLSPKVVGTFFRRPFSACGGRHRTVQSSM